MVILLPGWYEQPSYRAGTAHQDSQVREFEVREVFDLVWACIKTDTKEKKTIRSRQRFGRSGFSEHYTS